MQCPFCQSKCTPADVRFVADDTLRGDPALGPHAAVRFQPIAFTTDAKAMAPDGSTSTTPACPHCRAAWHSTMRRDPAPALLCVGPDGLSRAIALAQETAFSIVRDDMPTPCHTAEPSDVPPANAHTNMSAVQAAAVVTCTKDDHSVAFVLSTLAGEPHALTNALTALDTHVSESADQ